MKKKDFLMVFDFIYSSTEFNEYKKIFEKCGGLLHDTNFIKIGLKLGVKSKNF